MIFVKVRWKKYTHKIGSCRSKLNSTRKESLIADGEFIDIEERKSYMTQAIVRVSKAVLKIIIKRKCISELSTFGKLNRVIRFFTPGIAAWILKKNLKKLEKFYTIVESILLFFKSIIQEVEFSRYLKCTFISQFRTMIQRVLYLILFSSIYSLSLNAQESIIEDLDQQKDHFSNIAMKIWDFAEVGYLEVKSSQLLIDELVRNGFTVHKGVAGIPTAFEASFGSGEPVVGILAEYDALPGVSQEAIPEQKARVEGGAGHACGHHLFGTGSVAAAISVKKWLEETKTPGTIKLFGTPAEEGGAGKVYMARAGLFNRVDAMLHWHPGDSNAASATSSLANKSAKFRFYGVASHASSAPQNGKSALDAVEAMNFMVNLLREHIPMESRIHYVITSGGEAPNVVPAFAEVFYYCRHPEMRVVKENFEKLVTIANAAAMGTGTTVEYEVIHGIYNLLPNETLSRVMHNNLLKVGGLQYNDYEVEFAEKIAKTLPESARKNLSISQKIAPFEVRERGKGGSTDVGDVSWQTPTAGLRTATWVPGTSAHTWQAVAAGGTSIGFKGMMVAAKTLSLTAIEIFNNPSVCEKAKEELLRRRGKDFEYEPLLGNREPPLDYRK